MPHNPSHLPPGQIPPIVLVGNLDLRDWFAGNALVGIMELRSSLDSDVRDYVNGTLRPGVIDYDLDARRAYRMADAMLRARIL